MKANESRKSPNINETLTGSNRSSSVTANCERGRELEFTYDHNRAQIRKFDWVRVNHPDAEQQRGQIARISQWYDMSIRVFVIFENGFSGWYNAAIVYKSGGAK